MRDLIKLAIKVYRTVTVMGVIRLKDALELRYGKTTSKIVVLCIYKVTVYTPIAIIKYFPKSLASLFGSCALTLNCDRNKVFQWANRAAQSKFSGHKKAAFFIKANFMFRNYSEHEFKEFIDKEVFSDSSNIDLVDFYIVWSFHNNSQHGHSSLISKIVKKLEANDLRNEIDLKRYLPEHTTNMGHLGYLFLYANYYRKFDPGRYIAIWPDISPNKFYLSELIKILPFKTELISGNPSELEIPKNQIDTLNYSRINKGQWRLESATDAPTMQSFPEFIVNDDFILKSNDNFTDYAQSQLQRIGFDKDKWFVALHIKEHRFGFEIGGEVRDAPIESYNSTCELINELGGQVVRMGGSNFPKLVDNFPAIDYAHSVIKSEELDYWLWANCKFWVGSSNGASVAVIPFRKPRLLTNLWPFHASGPPTDFCLPKLVYNRVVGQLVPIEQIVSMKLSRNMKKDLFTQSNLILIENSPELLRNSTLELYESLISQNNEKSKIISTFESEIYKAMKLAPDTPKMRIPQSYNDFLAKIQTTKFLL